MPSCGVRLSVCLSVTFVYSVKTNKHIFKIFTVTILVFPYPRHDNILTGATLTRVLNVGGQAKDRDSRRIAGYQSMTGGVRTTTATVHRAVYRTDGHASVNLYHNQHGRSRRREEKRTEFIYTQR